LSVILRNAFAETIHGCQRELGLSISLLGGGAKPISCLIFVSTNDLAQAAHINMCEPNLSGKGLMSSSSQVPVLGCAIVKWNPCA
jgi:hypothetical protein